MDDGLARCYVRRVPGAKGHAVTDEATTLESDADFRVRIINAYGMWGAFCTVVLESHGRRLDDCGKHVGLTRLATERARKAGGCDE